MDLKICPCAKKNLYTVYWHDKWHLLHCCTPLSSYKSFTYTYCRYPLSVSMVCRKSIFARQEAVVSTIGPRPAKGLCGIIAAIIAFYYHFSMYYHYYHDYYDCYCYYYYYYYHYCCCCCYYYHYYYYLIIIITIIIIIIIIIIITNIIVIVNTAILFPFYIAATNIDSINTIVIMIIPMIMAIITTLTFISLSLLL